METHDRFFKILHQRIRKFAHCLSYVLGSTVVTKGKNDAHGGFQNRHLN